MTRQRILTIASTAAALALAGCATLEEEAVDAVAHSYNATLTGAQEVGGGDPDGTGRAEITVADNLDQVCWELSGISNIATPTAAHIHQGAAGTNGPPVFTLTKSNEGRWQGCQSDSEWDQKALEANPAGFYVNVHNAEYPGGAIRGQLSR